MNELLIRIGSALFLVAAAGAVLGVAMSVLFAPAAATDEQEQSDERSEKRRY